MKEKTTDTNTVKTTIELPPIETIENTEPSKRRSNGPKKKLKKPKQKTEDVVIKPLEGYSYAEVLKALRKNVKPKEADVAVRSISKTKTGSILLVMGKGGEKDKFRDAIKNTLKEAAEVKSLNPKLH